LPAHNNQRRQKKKRKIQRTSETIEKVGGDTVENEEGRMTKGTKRCRSKIKRPSLLVI
jgi:hypothetical protein